MRPVRILVVLVLAALMAGGCVKKSTHRKALEQIKTLEGQLADTQKELKDRNDRITTLEGDLQKLQTELDTFKNLSDEELRKIRGEKEATEQELTQLRAQRDAQE